MHSYSQNMEDLMLYRLLHKKENGFYIDIGAHDPDELSVTKLFYEKGWSGINVEPVATSFKRIEKSRERDINIHAVISDVEGYSYFYEITGNKKSYNFDPSALSSLDQEVVVDACKKFDLDYDIIRIKSYRLETICKKYCVDTEIDFMKIDVEGLELSVLQSGDFRKYRPKVLVIEATKPNCNIFETGNPNDQGVWDTFEPFLFSVDYVFVYFDGLNRFYLAKEHQHLQPLFSVPIGIYDGLHLPALQSAQENLSRQKGQLLAEKETLKTQITDLAAEKDTLAAQAATLAAEKDALAGRMTALTAEKDTLAAQAAALAAEKDVLADRMAALAAEKDTLAAQAAALAAEKDALADRMTALAAEKDTLAAQAAALAAEKDALAGRMATLSDTVNSQQARLSSLTAAQEELREQNTALRKANSILAQHYSVMEQHIHKVSDAFSQFPKTMQAHKAVLENLVKDNVLLRILAIEERYQWKNFPLTKFWQTWQTRKHALPVVPTLEAELGRCVADQQILDTQLEQAIRQLNNFPVMPKIETVPDTTVRAVAAVNACNDIQYSSDNSERFPLIVTPATISNFAYGKKHHFAALRKQYEPLFLKSARPLHNIKLFQNLIVLAFILQHLPKGARLLEIGGGDSQILKCLIKDYECWNLDGYEGIGNGPRSLPSDAEYKIVKDYIGNFNKELPDNYFDCVFSISVMEHLEPKIDILQGIHEDIHRVLKHGGFSFHSVDNFLNKNTPLTGIFIKNTDITNMQLLTPNSAYCNLAQEDDLWFMDKEEYEKNWMHIVKCSYEEWNTKACIINLLWQKPDSNKNYQLVRNFLHTKHPRIEVAVKTRPAAILGNGPSLRGFDFKGQLQGFDTFGMNAAYRFWDTIGWYPTYYSCLDTTLGMSHKQAIERLIRESEKNGIRGFLLRDNLIKALGETGKHPYVVNFDTVRSGNPFLSNNQITTGSHTTSWAAMLGYHDIILLGIDANYVEILPEAKPVEGIILEMAETPSENPNYFFDAYQQKGDRYHIPNVQKGPEKAVHLVSWRNIMPILHFSECVVVNANPISCVDAFPKCPFPEALERIATIRAEREKKKAVSSLSGPYTRAQGMECDEISIVRPFLPAKKGIMFDVGAHHGGTCIPFLQDGWKVFAFEPDQERRQILTQNTEPYASVHIDARAVSDSSGKQVAWYASSESTGIGSMQAFTARHTSRGMVTTVSLAQFCLEQRTNRIDFLKIDTEGFDEFVLRGFPFNHIKPACIICEFEDKKSVALCSNIHSMAHILLKNEYHVYVSEWHPIIRYGIPHQWCRFTPYPMEVLDPMAWGNLVAFARKPDSDKLVAAVKQALRRQS